MDWHSNSYQSGNYQEYRVYGPVGYWLDYYEYV